MPRIVISDEAFQAIHRKAEQKPCGGEHLSDGRWSIPVGWLILGRLRGEQKANETLSDTIVRICKHKGNGSHADPAQHGTR